VEPQPAAPARTSPAPATPSAPTPPVLRGGAETEKEKVRCSFTSTPSGAEIDLDGKYVGNTPSQIAVSTGMHVITFSMPGFGQWKRELSVLPGSELTVSAILQKD
ncbi:MAG: PEGA domain-containing protein, partial [Candidatus Sulfotelmatobacter sp.]